MTGKSGVTHCFDLLIRNGDGSYGVDVCEKISAPAILRSYVKKLETSTSYYIVYLGSLLDEVERLARLHQIARFHHEELESS